jgi:hypothetical protein
MRYGVIATIKLGKSSARVHLFLVVALDDCRRTVMAVATIT